MKNLKSQMKNVMLFCNPIRRISDVDVSTRCRTWNGVSKSNKRNPRGTKIRHNRLAFAAVGAESYVDRVSVIKSEMVVNRSLTKGAYRQRVVEFQRKEGLNFCSVGQNPG